MGNSEHRIRQVYSSNGNDRYSVCLCCGIWRTPYWRFWSRVLGKSLAEWNPPVSKPFLPEALCPGSESALSGDNIPDFNDVWGGAGPDFCTSTPVLTGA